MTPTSVDAQCDKLATVVGRRLIALSVHLSVQRDGRDLARRAGLSAAAGTCYTYGLVTMGG